MSLTYREAVKMLEVELEEMLPRAIALIEVRLEKLANGRDPFVCVAEGRLMSAVEILREAANMLGEEGDEPVT